jgi:agmatinase
MDVVELCPREGQTRADFLAAKLVYKMIGYRFYGDLK